MHLLSPARRLYAPPRLPAQLLGFSAHKAQNAFVEGLQEIFSVTGLSVSIDLAIFCIAQRNR